MKNPVIALTSNTLHYAESYADAVERADGEPWVVTPDDDISTSDVLELAGGLVLCGGEDVHPSWYGEEPVPDVEMHYNAARDTLEIPLLRAALDADFPVYAICRGVQVLNVTLGGRLIQHMEGHSIFAEGGEELSQYHRIYISPGSKLAAVVGSGGFVRVNSRHHQGIKEPQKSSALLASAYSLEDGYIEALESPGHRWVIGVQFHPERRMEVPPHFDRLFQSLVERASEGLRAAQ